MNKISIEVMQRQGDIVTVIVPEHLNRMQILGIAEQLLKQFGLPFVKIAVGDESSDKSYTDYDPSFGYKHKGD
jgi:3-deoxy-D-manno-octulosonic-acid transferase